MGKFDEFAQAEEDMKGLGDTPPEITQEGDPAEEASEGSGEFQVKDDGTSGGLGERVVEEEGAQFSVEDVLGIGKPSTDPEPEVQAEEKPASPEAPETSTDARFSEMSEQLKFYREQNEKLTEKLLQPDAPSGEPEVNLPDELDADVVDYFKPYIEAELGKRMSAVEESMAPMRKASEDSMLATEIAHHVEGFKAEHVPALQAAFDAIPENQRAVYQGSVAGATLLAQKMAKEGSFGHKTRKQTPNPMASRHQTESGSGIAGNQSGEVDEAEKIRRLNSMSDDDVMAIINRM